MKLDGKSLTTEALTCAVRCKEKIEISEDSKVKMQKSRDFVEKMFREQIPAYGTTTGIGELASVILSPEQAKKLSTYMVYSHASGYGEALPEEVVRAAIITRLNVLAKGVSGVRVEVADFIAEMLNCGVIPVMYPASVGACGDLAPLAQAMLVPLGKGDAFYKGKRLPGKEALAKAGLKPIQYEIRDGLAVINGSQLIAGLASLEISDANTLIRTSEITAALTFEALKAVTLAFDDEILCLRGFEGGIKCASNIRRLIRNSTILGKPERVQDAYSIRSTPQVIGSVKDALDFVKKQVEIEINSGADNPLFVPKDTKDSGRYLTGANFQGTPVALPLELLGMGITTVSIISERRLNRLINPNLNIGLPGFLIEGAGMYTGIMIPQYTSAYLVNENRVLCTPAATGSIPTAADQEDFVSMGTNTAIKTRKIIDNAFAVVAIELMTAAQAVDLRIKKEGGKLGQGTQVAYDFVRNYVNFLDEDRPLYPDIERVANAIKTGELLKAVEKVTGGLD
jgi:histidine ammonia-lyase